MTTLPPYMQRGNLFAFIRSPAAFCLLSFLTHQHFSVVGSFLSPHIFPVDKTLGWEPGPHFWDEGGSNTLSIGSFLKDQFISVSPVLSQSRKTPKYRFLLGVGFKGTYNRGWRLGRMRKQPFVSFPVAGPLLKYKFHLESYISILGSKHRTKGYC